MRGNRKGNGQYADTNIARGTDKLFWPGKNPAGYKRNTALKPKHKFVTTAEFDLCDTRIPVGIKKNFSKKHNK